MCHLTLTEIKLAITTDIKKERGFGATPYPIAPSLLAESSWTNPAVLFSRVYSLSIIGCRIQGNFAALQLGNNPQRLQHNHYAGNHNQYLNDDQSPL